jgi:flagellar basal-body rod protein FlgB
MIDTANMNILERFLDLASFRQALISSNLANIDTPGYKTVDIDFQRELSRATAAPSGELFLPSVEEVQGLITRPDGNNVSVDRESLLLGETQLQFTVAIQLMRAEFQNLTQAVTGGTGT